ncbi:MAG: thermonuclease family protein, partial [Fervidobacterium sp.]
MGPNFSDKLNKSNRANSKRFKVLFSTMQIGMILISLGILSFTFSCTADSSLSQKPVCVNVNVLVPIHPQTLAFEKDIDKVVINVFDYQNGESLLVRDYPNINNISFEIPKGEYKIRILGYINSGSVLYIHGETLLDLRNVSSNAYVTIKTELISGRAKIKVVPDLTKVQGQTFEIIQATATFVNQLTEQVLETSTNTANLQSIEDIEIELLPGMWSTSVEILAKNSTNEIDVRYAKSFAKIIYVEPNHTVNVKLQPIVPSTSEIGEVVVVFDIHDGDTFKDNMNQSYRVIGIDAPEVSAGTKPIGEYNQDAKQFLIDFASHNGTQGVLRVINRGTDTYGRVLAYVFDKYGRLFYEEEICKSGYARPLFYSDNEIQDLTQRISQAYKQAYTTRRGIFSKLENAPLIVSSTSNKSDYVGKIVWLQGLVTSITSDSTKYTIQLDDGWA